jgi:alpha-amylase
MFKSSRLAALPQVTLLAAVTSAVPALGPVLVHAQNVSAPATLQIFDTTWQNIERRAPDIFMAGYGAMWTPPPGRADLGNFSVGYDVYDRFDLGSAGNSTLYGTETGYKRMIREMRRIGVSTYSDLILNHNGYSGTGSAQSRSDFAAAGAYPGFVISTPTDPDGDFHGAFEGGDWHMRLAGLIDIAQEKNHVFIRNPVTPGDPRNIPQGTVSAFGRVANVPTAANRRLYPDRDGPFISVFNPATGQGDIRIYQFNQDDPMTGDAIAENATGLLMRNAQWMVQTIGVDGFRLDATKHMPQWFLDQYFDLAVYRSNPRKLLNGQTQHVFSFGENYTGDMGLLQSYVKKSINPNQPGVVGANRDTKDFPLFFALRNNLTSNGFQNDWRNVINSSFDVNDDGLSNNGSQGVSFVNSHDDFGPALSNVGHAFTMLRPGNAIVYMNAKQFGPNRDFPKDGRADALGGLYGDTITKLTNIRNTHGRGNFIPRLTEKEILAYERENSVLVLLSNRTDGGFDSRTISTGFAPGTPLIELTGNASNPTIDPFNDFPELVVVNNDRTVNVRVPRNRAPGANGALHNTGYLMYGPSGPQGTLSLTNVVETIAPEVATDMATNATARLTAIDVIKANSFDVKLQTNQVRLLGFLRDADADGDNALFSVNRGIDAKLSTNTQTVGLDLNGNGVVDFTNPGSPQYGFESFITKRSPLIGGGDGEYRQTIDASKLPEGYNYIEVRAFRKRNGNEPSIYSSFRKVVYVDRLKPESVIDSFKPFSPFNGDNDIWIRSTDMTAEEVRVFWNVPSSFDEADILEWIEQGQGTTDRIDRDIFKTGTFGLPNGNNVVTIYTKEMNGTYNIQRMVGVQAGGSLGGTMRGFGLADLTHDSKIDRWDFRDDGNAFEGVLFSRNTRFNPAGDLNADGMVDTRDMWLMPSRLNEIAAETPPNSIHNIPAAQAALREVIRNRGNINQEFGTDQWDIDAIYRQIGQTAPADIWWADLNVDGLVDQLDVDLQVRGVFQTEYGDVNLDGKVDAADLDVLATNFDTAGGWARADFNGDSLINLRDFYVLARNWGYGVSGGLAPASISLGGVPLTVPEPTVLAIGLAGGVILLRRRR